MVQGLPKNPENQSHARKWIHAQIEEARALLDNTWKLPEQSDEEKRQGIQRTEQDKADLRQAQISANPFYDQVKHWKDRIPDPNLLQQKLDSLEEEAFRVMQEGKAPKGFFAILMDSFTGFGQHVQEAFSTFDITDPFNTLGAIPGRIMRAIGGMIRSAIGNTIMNHVSDQTAGVMKAMQHNYLEHLMDRMQGKPFKELSTEEATRNLEYQNAGKALREYLGAKEEERTFGERVAGQIENYKPQSNTSDRGRIPFPAAEEAQRAGAGAQARHDGFTAPNGVTPPGRPQTPPAQRPPGVAAPAVGNP